jgi:predicted MFS family arabinose efflux permease
LNSATRYAPFGVGPFGRLATSYAVNELGDWLGAIALAVLVFGKTGDPLALTALFVAAKLVPAFASPALTARLDQMAVRRALPALYLAEAICFALLALFAASFFLPAVLAIALFDGVLLLSARSISRAAVSATLEPAGLLREGNALINIAFAVGTAGGPALAGLVVAGVGPSAALLVDAASFLIIAVLLATARGLPDAHPEPEPWGKRIRDGLAYVRGRRVLRTLITGQALAFVFFTVVVPIEVVYAKEALDTTDTGFGILLASWGVGIVLGSLIFTWTRKGSMLALIGISTALVGVAYLGMASTESLVVACLISVAGGAGNGIQWVAVVTAVQELTEQDYQARVIGLLESVGAAMPGIGFVLGGVVAATLGPREAYAVAGAGVLVVLAGAALAMRTRRSSNGAKVSSASLPPG